MKFSPYSGYKPSGIEWLENVPEHWSVYPLKWSVQTVKGGVWGDEPQGNEHDLVCIRVADFNRNKLNVQIDRLTIRNISPSEQNGRVLAFGDLLLEKSGGGENQPVGCVIQYDQTIPAVCSNFIARLVPSQEALSGYFKYVHASIYSLRLTTRSINQTSGIQNLDTDRYLSEKVPYPPIYEQTTITSFLDRETAKIDTLITKQEKLIELLKEKRQAVISHAVTKGLYPTVPMKPSGVEWLGDVPVHWERAQLGRLCTKVSDGPHFSPDYVDDGVMFISARNIKVEGWALDDAKFISEDDYREFNRRVAPEVGDVLYTKGGTTGIARVVDFHERFQVWVHVAVLKIRKELADPYFVAYALNAIGCYEQSQLHTRGATNNDLGLTRMIKIWMALPPLDEQTAIVQSLDTATSKIDTLIHKAEQAINLQKEHRTALISAAVTGKIDVHEVITNLQEAA